MILIEHEELGIALDNIYTLTPPGSMNIQFCQYQSINQH